MSGNMLIGILILFPFISSIFAYILGKQSRKILYYFCLAVSVLEFAGFLCLLLKLDVSHTLLGDEIRGYVFAADLFGKFGLNFSLDGIRTGFIMLTSFVWTIFNMLYGPDKNSCFDLMALGAVIGVYSGADIFTILIFFIIMVAVSTVGIKGIYLYLNILTCVAAGLGIIVYVSNPVGYMTVAAIFAAAGFLIFIFTHKNILNKVGIFGLMMLPLLEKYDSRPAGMFVTIASVTFGILICIYGWKTTSLPAKLICSLSGIMSIYGVETGMLLIHSDNIMKNGFTIFWQCAGHGLIVIPVLIIAGILIKNKAADGNGIASVFMRNVMLVIILGLSAITVYNPVLTPSLCSEEPVIVEVLMYALLFLAETLLIQVYCNLFISKDKEASSDNKVGFDFKLKEKITITVIVIMYVLVDGFVFARNFDIKIFVVSTVVLVMSILAVKLLPSGRSSVAVDK